MKRCRICGRVTNGMLLLGTLPIHQRCLDGIKTLLPEISEKSPLLKALRQEFVLRHVHESSESRDTK